MAAKVSRVMRWPLPLVALLVGIVLGGLVVWNASYCQPCECVDAKVVEREPCFDRLWERTALDCGAALAAMRASLDACRKGR